MSSARRHLVDVRETAWSRKPGFSKGTLQRTLVSRGIEYIHAEFKVPSDGLAGSVVGIPREKWEPVFGAGYSPGQVERWTKVEGSRLTVY